MCQVRDTIGNSLLCSCDVFQAQIAQSQTTGSSSVHFKKLTPLLGKIFSLSQMPASPQPREVIILLKVKLHCMVGGEGGGGGGGGLLGCCFWRGVEIQSQKLNVVLKSRWSINNNKN